MNRTRTCAAVNLNRRTSARLWAQLIASKGKLRNRRRIHLTPIVFMFARAYTQLNARSPGVRACASDSSTLYGVRLTQSTTGRGVA